MFTQKIALGSLVLFGSFFSVGCTEKSSGVQIVQKSHDVTISALTSEEVSAYKAAQPALDMDCEARLRAITCHSEKAALGYDPHCSLEAVSEEFFTRLLAAANELPPLAKKVFCNLNRLQIQPHIFSIGYASQIRDEKRVTIGNMIGIRTDVLSGKGEFDLWSWKEQLNFGLSQADDPEYKLSPLGPRIIEDFPGSQYSLFLGVMVHEIGHLLDFMNEANKVDYAWPPDMSPDNPNPALVKATHREGSFGRFSWPDYSFMSDGSNWPPVELKKAYPRLTQLCYYNCAETGTIDPSLIHETYGELQKTSFVTSYSSSSEMEDFAESFTYVSLRDRHAEYKIVAADGTVLHSSTETLQSARYKEKLQWVQDFITKPDLVYKVLIPEERTPY